MNTLHFAQAFLATHLDVATLKYIGLFLTPPRYCWNISVALFNLARATAGIYRPNGDGYVLSWWRSVDCLGNALALGDPTETISSRAAKARVAGQKWGCVLCLFLGWCATLLSGKFTDHCAESLDPAEGAEAIIPDGK